MIAPPIPTNEPQRLAALYALKLLDTPPEQRFDRITLIAQHVFGVPISLISLVDAHRQWFKSACGIDVCETSREISFCAHAILGDRTMVVPDAQLDPRFCDNPLVTGGVKVRFYAGRPLAGPDGSRVGTLCVVDTRPRDMNDRELSILDALARIAENELGAVALNSALAELRKSEALLREFFDSAHDLIHSVTPDGRVSYANRAWLQSLGYSPAEALELSVWDIVHPSELSHCKSLFERALAGEPPGPIETVFVSRDGRSIDVEGSSVCLFSSGQPVSTRGTFRDVTARKRAEIVLREAEHRYRLLVDAAAQGIAETDVEGAITLCNPACASMLGYRSVDELIGRNMHQLVHHTRADGAPYPASECSIGRAFRSGESCHADNEVFWRADGTSFPVEYWGWSRRRDGAIIGCVVTFVDISKRREIENMKSEFISTVSHELRTPLTSIRGALGLLAAGLLRSQPDRGQRMLDIAIDNADRLTRLINDILDIEKMESGLVVMQMQTCDAGELINQACETVRPMADKFRVHLSSSPAAATLQGDADRIVQILTNLLSNAVKFSPAEATVRVSAQDRGDAVVFEVEDKGRGIPADKLETVFGRFQQVDASDARDKGGTGLGLAICSSIVEQHGGRIWVESEVGAGSRFSFSLPRPNST
jgi:PAS domain S-box-containing protein